MAVTRITFKTSGGIAHFPGLAQPRVIELSALPPSQAAELERLIEESRFFDLPEMANQPRSGAADYQQYTVTVEADGRSHTVRFVDPIADPKQQELIDAIRAAARAR